MKKKKRLLTLGLALALLCALAVPATAYDMGRVGQYSVISCGESHTAAIQTDGSLWMWGHNRYGELGTGSGDSSYVPVKVMDNVTAVSCGKEHTAALKADGTLWAWGKTDSGQLGNGSVGNVKDGGYTYQTVPIQVLDNVAAVSCGYYHTAAVKTDGTLWIWGRNQYGQLGNGTQNGSGFPIQVMDNVVAVSCGDYHTAAIRTDGSLWIWGYNSQGQLGNGGEGDVKTSHGYFMQTVPAKVMDNVAAVSCGESHTAAVQADGSLWVWGRDYYGQVGIGGKVNAKTQDHYSYPIQTVPVKVMDNVAAVSCGVEYTAAVQTDGSLWMWGYNISGQLGNGTTKSSKVPVQTLDNVSAVSCGTFHTIALRTDGTLWAWGRNSSGQLGNGGGGNMPMKHGGFLQTDPIQIDLKVAIPSAVPQPETVTVTLNIDGVPTPVETVKGQPFSVPANPTKEGHTFAGWYTDEALTIPWNFDSVAVGNIVLYAKWNVISSTDTTTAQSTQTVTLNGKAVKLQGYTLKAANGGDVTYVKLRDVAALLDGTSAQFNVDWRNGAIYVVGGAPYTSRNGTELEAITVLDSGFRWNTAPVLFDGVTDAMEGIILTDVDEGGHTFFKLRDLGAAIGFQVDWSAEKGIYIETK